MQRLHTKQGAARSLWLAAGVVLASALLAGRAEASEEARAPRRKKPARRPRDPDAARDAYALARMLESETDDPRARLIIGWITVQAARAWRKPLFRLLTGRSGQYGHQKYFHPDGRLEIRYASTVKEPGPEARKLARALLTGRARPPELIERTRPTAFVEMTRASKQRGPDGQPLQPAYDARRILRKQRSYGGIVARINRWFLYAQNATPIADVREAVAL